MSRLNTTAALVRSILENDPQTRNSDSLLYLKVLKICGERHNINIKNITISDFLLHLGDSVFPPFESVRRARQKLQAKIPELAANAEIQAFRAEEEQEYRAFALES